MNTWHSYPKIHALGHAAIADLLKESVTIEEKVDGSQFSFGRFDGELRCKSHHQELVNDAAGMFQRGVDAVGALDLHDGWTYRGEFLAKPKQNTITYSRVPAHHVALFDITTDHEAYMSRGMKECEADRLGMEIVPCVEVKAFDMDGLREALDRESFLGGAKIEGIVIKNYSRFSRDGHVMMGKFVSEAFKEKHMHEWKTSNPSKLDVIDFLISRYRCEPRWIKAVQYLKDSGQLLGEPKDIGPLLNRAKADIIEECEEEIKEELWKWAKDKICRGAVCGIAEWYKEQLAAKQFDAEGQNS